MIQYFFVLKTETEVENLLLLLTIAFNFFLFQINIFVKFILIFYNIYVTYLREDNTESTIEMVKDFSKFKK